MREIIKTEDPNGSLITVDTLDDDCGSTENREAVRLWSKDFTLIGSWCNNCNRFHNAAGHQ